MGKKFLQDISKMSESVWVSKPLRYSCVFISCLTRSAVCSGVCYLNLITLTVIVRLNCCEDLILAWSNLVFAHVIIPFPYCYAILSPEYSWKRLPCILQGLWGFSLWKDACRSLFLYQRSVKFDWCVKTEWVYFFLNQKKKHKSLFGNETIRRANSPNGLLKCQLHVFSFEPCF